MWRFVHFSAFVDCCFLALSEEEGRYSASGVVLKNALKISFIEGLSS
jgi:hypothetical protein